MKYEWHWILGIVGIVVLGLLFVSAESSMTIGWLSLVCGFYWLVWIVVRSGRKARRDRPREGDSGDAVMMHRWQVATLIGWVFVGVAGIEIGVRKAGGLWGDPWFIAFHLVLVAGMTLTFIVARFVHTGIRRPDRHWMFVYAFALFYGATLVTGTMLLEDKFHFYGDVGERIAKGESSHAR